MIQRFLAYNEIDAFFKLVPEIIDSGKVTADYVKRILLEKNLINKSKKKGCLSFYVSDMAYKFSELGSRFFGKEISAVRVDL